MLDLIRRHPRIIALSVLVHLAVLGAVDAWLSRQPPLTSAHDEAIQVVTLTDAADSAVTPPAPGPGAESPPQPTGATPNSSPEPAAPSPAELRRLQREAEQQQQQERQRAEQAIRRLELANALSTEPPPTAMPEHPQADETRHVEEERRRAQTRLP